MPALASLEDLKKAKEDLEAVRLQYPEGVEALSTVIKKHRALGYKNVIKLLLGEATPEKLKGEG